MRKLFLLGISVLIVAVIFLILLNNEYAQIIKTEEYLKIACSKPGTSCPILDTSTLWFYGIISLVLVLLGSGVLAFSRKN